MARTEWNRGKAWTLEPGCPRRKTAVGLQPLCLRVIREIKGLLMLIPQCSRGSR